MLSFRRALVVLILGGWGAVRLPATIPDGDPIIDRSENMCVNGDFEQHSQDFNNPRPLRWWVESTGLQTVAVSTTHNKTPNISSPAQPTSLKIMDSSSTLAAIVRSEKCAANAGTVYTADGWIWCESGTSGSIYLEFWDENNTRVGVINSPTSASASWVAITTLSLAAPAGTTHVNIAVATTQASMGVSYFDEIKLRAVKAAPVVQLNVRELMIDDALWEDFFNVERKAWAGVKSGPVLSKTAAWETTFLSVDTVLKDKPAGSGYKMWYHSNGEECYATSPDGITWTKPILNTYTSSLTGTTANNICFEQGGLQGTISLIYDDADVAAKRYKAVQYRATAVFGGASAPGYYVFSSPTGINTWAVENGGVAILPFHDVITLAYKQTTPGAFGTYVVAHKQNMYNAKTTVAYNANLYDRAAFISTSTNFTTWQAPGFPSASPKYALAIEGDFADDLRVRAKRGWEAQIYGMSVFPYESVYVGMPWMFDIMNYSDGDDLTIAGYGAGQIFGGIASSRDLRIWGHPVRAPVIPNGSAGEWDDGTIYPSNSLLVDTSTLKLYYGGANVGHAATFRGEVQTSRIGLSTWRRDGFVSLHNGGGDIEGYAVTKSFVIPAGATSLQVNTVIGAIPGSQLLVSILDSTGTTEKSGFGRAQAIAITGDQLSAVASWTGGTSISSLAGQTVKLKFYLTGGELYSFWVH